MIGINYGNYTLFQYLIIVFTLFPIKNNSFMVNCNDLFGYYFNNFGHAIKTF